MKEELIELADILDFRSMFFPSSVMWISYKEKRKHYLWMCELQQYIRKTYNIDVVIIPNVIGYEYVIYYKYPPKAERNRDFFETYEEALETGLVRLIKLIKDIRDEDNSNQGNNRNT